MLYGRKDDCKALVGFMNDYLVDISTDGAVSKGSVESRKRIPKGRIVGEF